LSVPSEKQQTAQEFSVKRAQVEFHNFASLGEPERAMRVYKVAILRQSRTAFSGPHTDSLGAFNGDWTSSED